ncbi:CRISPR-associated protein Csx16 [Methylomonas rhizoryzae]|uniref:CRISPR-associated protein Csx16 n=1 Tax=Methylomonas rhizoryzae TaxID=2608981 RepID=UPI0012323345|nr:CRISPR-associated protein Csx16 [Methylomonas rhizoryzae]
MPTYFIPRHPGAIAWAEQQGISVDRQIAHLDIDLVQPGDTIIGSLPVNLAAKVCNKSAVYLHLSLNAPEQWRGQELSAAQMAECGARLERRANDAARPGMIKGYFVGATPVAISNQARD